MAQLLLPLVCVVALLFLAALPFTGLEPLWSTGSATPLLLCLLALLAIALNTTYEDGRGSAPSRWLGSVARAAALTMPIYAAIALYATSLRARQYGLTPDRVYAVALVAIAIVFSVGYAVAALRRGGAWMRGIEVANVAGFIALVAVGVALPPLDPFRLSAAEQFQRFASGRVAVADFDFGALRFALGRYGWERLREIEGLTTHPEAEAARVAIAELRAAKYRWSLENSVPKLSVEAFVRVPITLDLSAQLLERLPSDGPMNLAACTPERCLLLGVDIDADGRDERCVIAVEEYLNGRVDLYTRCYSLARSGEWRSIGRLVNVAGDLPFAELKRQLESSGPSLQPSRYREIQIGNGAFVLAPDAE